VHPKVDQRAGRLSLPHVGITKTERNEKELKHKMDENRSRNSIKTPYNNYGHCNNTIMITRRKRMTTLQQL